MLHPPRRRTAGDRSLRRLEIKSPRCSRSSGLSGHAAVRFFNCFLPSCAGIGGVTAHDLSIFKFLALHLIYFVIRCLFPVLSIRVALTLAHRNRPIVESIQNSELGQRLLYGPGWAVSTASSKENQALQGIAAYSDILFSCRCILELFPLKIKEVRVGESRCIVCLNSRQPRKEAADREAIIESLKKRPNKGPISLVGNKGCRKYLEMDRKRSFH